MKKLLLALAAALVVVALPTALLAQMGGGMGNGNGSSMGGNGMIVIADDGSILVVDMDMSSMGQNGNVDRALVSIAPDGTERWRTSFTDGWPMMPVTEGDLVVVTLRGDWWMDGGDGGWDHGHGHGKVRPTDTGDTQQLVVVGLDLASGQERWRATLDGDMGGNVRMTDDGSRIYVTVMTIDNGGGMGGGSIHQGDAPGSGMMGGRSIVALDRDGNVLWTHDLGSTGGMGGGGK